MENAGLGGAIACRGAAVKLVCEGLKDTSGAFAWRTEGVERKWDEESVHHGQWGVGLQEELIPYVACVRLELIRICGFSSNIEASCSEKNGRQRGRANAK